MLHCSNSVERNNLYKNSDVNNNNNIQAEACVLMF